MVQSVAAGNVIARLRAADWSNGGRVYEYHYNPRTDCPDQNQLPTSHTSTETSMHWIGLRTVRLWYENLLFTTNGRVEK